MGKRDDRRRLELRREQLRHLTGLSTDHLVGVAGGGEGRVLTHTMDRDSGGRVYSYTCRDQ